VAGEAECVREPRGRGVLSVGPQAQAPVGQGEQPLHEFASDAASTVVGVDGQLTTGAFDLVCDVQVGVPDERTVGRTCEYMDRPVIATVGEVQPHVLTDGADPVGFGDVLE